MANLNPEKILLIGWDGADWKTINSLLDKGLMPNLSKLVNQGTIGNLATLDPPFSPMLWSSIATGKRPYKHGVMGFHEPSPDGENIRPVLSLSRKCKAIWNILTQKNKKTHVVGWWPSHPAEPINGVAISNFFQRANKEEKDNWELAPHAVHPQEDAAHFAQLRIHPHELTAAHIQPFIPNLAKLKKHFLKEVAYLTKILAENASLQSAFTNILRTKEWDFASVYFDGIDRVCHEFMKYHPPKQDHIPQDEFDLFNEIISGVYRFHDMMLGRQLELAGEDVTVILVSDHGFESDHLRPREVSNEPAGIAYEHSQYGIFLAKGPGIKKDNLVYGASILDITPTILHLLDLPIADDMDGLPLLSIFEDPKIPKNIDSWENVPGQAGMPTTAFLKNQSLLDKMMAQLVDLGYIDQPSENKAEAYEHTRRFCDTNLARAYFDGGQLPEAIQLFSQLHEENPKAPWIAFRLAICYQIVGEHVKCRALIQQLKESHFYNSTMLVTMEASLLMGEGEYQKAVDVLQKLEAEQKIEHSDQYLKIAYCYSILGQPEKAKNAIKNALTLDYDNPLAHQFIGIWYFNHQYFEQASEHLLTAIGLDYNLGTTHFYLAQTLLSLGKYDEAVDAFEVTLNMMPHNNQARELLSYTLRTHLDAPERAIKVMQDFNKYLQGTITVVSGLPRSGTSMMMQMLEKGGLPIFTDKERDADENNPKGYYEHQIVKKITHNKEWLKMAKGKGVKIVAPLITHLPYNYKYKVIFMERNPYEIYASQIKMLNRLGKNNDEASLSLAMIDTLKETLTKSKKWLNRHPSVEVLYLSYADILNSPLESAIRIADFLQANLNPIEMIACIDSNLYREKSTH